MRVINATWEQRNLGVECVEFEVEQGDSLEEIRKTLLSSSAEYQIAKAPVGDVSIQTAIQECGFRFFETNIQLERKIDSTHFLPPMYARFAKDITYHDATSEELETILAEVESGTMFTTDKVAQDPFFSPQLSGRRYTLWARDIIAKGARTVLGLFKGRIASFTIYEDKEKFYRAFIGGMLNEYRDRGMGFIPLYVTAEQISDAGGGILKTGVSSNNPAILKLQLLFGAKITEMTNVYVKHM